MKALITSTALLSFQNILILICLLVISFCLIHRSKKEPEWIIVYVDPDVDGGFMDGTSLKNAYPTLQKAIVDRAGDITDTKGIIFYCTSYQNVFNANDLVFEGWTVNADGSTPIIIMVQLL